MPDVRRHSVRLIRHLPPAQHFALRHAVSWANRNGKDHRYAHWYLDNTPMRLGHFASHMDAWEQFRLEMAFAGVGLYIGDYQPGRLSLCRHCEYRGFFPWKGIRVWNPRTRGRYTQPGRPRTEGPRLRWTNLDDNLSSYNGGTGTGL